jgi:hypothetical protein
MRKLFSGNADVVAVFIIVLTIGLAYGGHEFSRVRQVRDRVLTRVPATMQRIPDRMQRIPDRMQRIPARLQRIPVRLRLAQLREQHPVLKHVICQR